MLLKSGNIGPWVLLTFISFFLTTFDVYAITQKEMFCRGLFHELIERQNDLTDSRESLSLMRKMALESKLPVHQKDKIILRLKETEAKRPATTLQFSGTLNDKGEIENLLSATWARFDADSKFPDSQDLDFAKSLAFLTPLGATVLHYLSGYTSLENVFVISLLTAFMAAPHGINATKYPWWDLKRFKEKLGATVENLDSSTSEPYFAQIDSTLYTNSEEVFQQVPSYFRLILGEKPVVIPSTRASELRNFLTSNKIGTFRLRVDLGIGENPQLHTPVLVGVFTVEALTQRN